SGALLLSCAQNPVSPSQPEPVLSPDNPFRSVSALPYQLPPFDRIRNEHFAPAFEVGMLEQRKEVAAIASSTEAPTFSNTIEALERSGRLLARVSAVFGNLASSHTNPEIQALQKVLAPQLSAHQDAIYLDAALYARIRDLYERRASLGL